MGAGAGVQVAGKNDEKSGSALFCLGGRVLLDAVGSMVVLGLTGEDGGAGGPMIPVSGSRSEPTLATSSSTSMVTFDSSNISVSSS